MTKERVYELLIDATCPVEVEIDEDILMRCKVEADKIDVPLEDYVSALVIQNLMEKIQKSNG